MRSGGIQTQNAYEFDRKKIVFERKSSGFFKRFLHLPFISSLKFLCGMVMVLQKVLPLNITSRIWGWLNSIDLPILCRRPIFLLYSWVYGCNLTELVEPNLNSYKNLSEFFRRAIRPECRPVDEKSLLVSPVDGRILSIGPLHSGEMHAVKGICYTLEGFLGPTTWNANNELLATSSQNCGKNNVRLFTDSIKKEIHSMKTRCDVDDESDDSSKSDDHSKIRVSHDTRLYHVVIYLAPGDYHRFHSPTNWSVNFRRHFPGKLYSVNPLFTSWIKNLFCLNERALYVGHWQHGFFSMTAVGANNVGSISVYSDSNLQTNRPSSRVMRGAVRGWKFLVSASSKATARYRRNATYRTQYNCDSTLKHKSQSSSSMFQQRYYDKRLTTVDSKKSLNMSKGELFGEFNLGSTIVLIFEAPVNFEFTVKQDDRISVGQGIGRI